MAVRHSVVRTVGPYQFLELMDEKYISVFPLLDVRLESVKCVSYVWRSWAWQLQYCKHDADTCAGVRPFVEDTGSFMQLAARKAFWNMGHNQIANFAAEYQVGFKTCA